MAIGWLSMLQKLPWSEVIVNAPAVAQGAKKLWNTVAKKPPEAEPASDEAATPQAPADAAAMAQQIERIEARLAAAEAGGAELHRQMLASTELINALAEQNTQLVARVETLRSRLAWLAAASLVTGLAAIAALALWFARY
jgi:hypothetical protein